MSNTSQKPAQNTQSSQVRLVGVDVGGTFTDLVMIDPETSSVSLAKVPSTLDNQAFGVLAALDEAKADPASLGRIVHGTTTTTNAVLERKLAKTGLITTKGFRDVLELGRRTRPQAYGMIGSFTPIIPRDLRLEVSERVDAQGRVRTPLNEDEVRQAGQKLLELGCESVVVHFLHAYAHPDHERRAGEVLAGFWPNAYITLAHSLLSEAREFERGVTAAVNAAVQPLLERYVVRLNDDLIERGYQRDLLIMNGNGGMASARSVAKEAAKTVMSGPASGVMAAAFIGKQARYPNLITYDMGGTSTDVSLIRNATPSVSNEIELEYALPIHVPMVDVRTVGAGGGSIAKVNAAGLLEVGPESAGALPGPICYGRGGEEPTISDANLLLGRLDPARLKSVEGGVSVEDVSAIFQAKLGDPLGLSAVEAAEAVIRVANTIMAGATRMVSVSLGADPRDFALFAFGGAGPLHAGSIARELGIPTLLVPPRPGITNALGCVVADLTHDFVTTLNQPVDSLDMAAVHAILSAQTSEGEQLIADEAVEVAQVHRRYSADMQFVGQTHLLRVELNGPTPTRDELQARFEAAYLKRFQVELTAIKANLVNLNTTVVGAMPEPDLRGLLDPAAQQATLDEAITGQRPVRFDGRFHQTPVYWREGLPKHAKIIGPAIINQMDTTSLIEPGDHVTIDRHNNLIVHLKEAGEPSGAE